VGDTLNSTAEAEGVMRKIILVIVSIAAILGVVGWKWVHNNLTVSLPKYPTVSNNEPIGLDQNWTGRSGKGKQK
jgi:hypothetical protein